MLVGCPGQNREGRDEPHLCPVVPETWDSPLKEEKKNFRSLIADYGANGETDT